MGRSAARAVSLVRQRADRVGASGECAARLGTKTLIVLGSTMPG